jgi:circadian clock protein KaiC
LKPLLRPEAQTTVFHPSEIELTKITNLVLDETRKIKPTRVVFDSLSEFRLIAETALRYRRHLLNLKQEFAKQGRHGACCSTTRCLHPAPARTRMC